MFREQLINSFKGLKFNEGPHEYFHENEKLTPVSNYIEMYYEHFDADKVATKIARYTKRKKKDILKEWEEIKVKSLKLGKETHSFGEDYVNNLFFNVGAFKIAETGHQKAIVNFWNELPSNFIPEVTELKMFSVILKIAGTTDFILLNLLTRKLIICDYKTNKDLYKNYKEKTMLFPFHYLLDTPFNHYQIQLSQYQILLEEKGFEVEDRWIIWLKEDGTYEILKTADFTDIIKTTL